MAKTLADLKAAMLTVNKGITGIVRAFDNPPPKIVPAHLAAIILFLRSYDSAYVTMDVCGMLYRFERLIVGAPVGQGLDQDARLAELEPFVERVRTAYAAAITLSGTCEQCGLTGGSLEIRAGHATLIYNLEVEQKPVVTVSG